MKLRYVAIPVVLVGLIPLTTWILHPNAIDPLRTAKIQSFSVYTREGNKIWHNEQLASNLKLKDAIAKLDHLKKEGWKYSYEKAPVTAEGKVLVSGDPWKERASFISPDETQMIGLADYDMGNTVMGYSHQTGTIEATLLNGIRFITGEPIL